MAVAAQLAAAQERAFPARPIELIVPFAPGGGSGITGEVIKKIIADENLSPQQLTITFKPGASGQVGWTYLATRKGNAHTIATATASFSYGFVQKQMQVAPEDFTPIALMLVDTQLMVASPQSGFKTMQDVINASRKNPNSVKVGGTGASGSDANLAAMITSAVKIRLNYIPFKSGGEVNAAILGGHVDAAPGNPNALPAMSRPGNRAPRCFTDERTGSQDVPTMKEVGHNVSPTRRGIVAPAAFPKRRTVPHRVDEESHQSKGWAEYAGKNMMTVKFLAGPITKFADERAKLTAVLKDG